MDHKYNSEAYKDVPYMVHDEDMARLERSNERLCAIIIGLIVLCVASNAGWLYYESQYEDTVMTQEAEVQTDGGNAYVNNGGDMTYGESESKTDSTETE